VPDNRHHSSGLEQFRYSKTQRNEIAATLPIKNKTKSIAALRRTITAIRQLEMWAQEFRTDQARYTQNPPVETRKQLKRHLAAIEEILQLAPEIGGLKAALPALRERREQIAIEIDAYDRLTPRFHGGADFDREIFYFRVLAIWRESGGIIRTSHVSKTLKRFLAAAMTPVLGKSPTADTTIRGIIKRYNEAMQQGWLGTVGEFTAGGPPVLAGVDRVILIDGEDSQK
jgi:hypothetical protein